MAGNGKNPKRKWEKPRITLLERSEKQETVLAACKNHFSFLGGPGGFTCDSGLGSLICSEQTVT
jgi:hypothetical protein